MSKQKKIATLKEQEGIKTPSNFNRTAISKGKYQRKKTVDINVLSTKIKEGNIAALAQGITLLESTNVAHQQQAQELISKCLNDQNSSIRIGITGVPGVGKSTFIESLGTSVTALGKKVAVLAVDPTSTITKGSILGDKTRMESLVKNENAFIRPSPSGSTLGGVARKTRESIVLCEAAGYNVILIETVGVGQSEVAVHDMVDFFLLLKLAGAGDELQGIKRGIMEMADAVVINKADGANEHAAKLAKAEFARALHMYPPKANGWTPPTFTCSAIHNKGITELWDMIVSFTIEMKTSGHFIKNRQQQNAHWLTQTIEDQLKQKFYNNATIIAALDTYKNKVLQSECSPFQAAEILLKIHQEELK